MGKNIPAKVSRRDFVKLGGIAAGFASFGTLVTTNAYADVEAADYYLCADVGMGPKIRVLIQDNGSGLICFAPHNSERVASRVGVEYVKKHGGRFSYVINGGKRNITFRCGEGVYTFDPNRMFTNTGIKASLQKQGGTYSLHAHSVVRQFAGYVLGDIGALRQDTLVVGLHNNAPNGYSIRSYEQGREFWQDASKVHMQQDKDPHDFYFVTTEEWYVKLAAKKYNVVLQSNTALDDGSLSVYCASKGVPYINIEAGQGHVAAQTEMLEVLHGT